MIRFHNQNMEGLGTAMRQEKRVQANKKQRNIKVYKGKRFAQESILDIRTHFKATETFQYTHFSSCHPPVVKKGFIKGEAFRLFRTNSSETAFKTAISQAEITFQEKKAPLQQKHKDKQVLPFVTQHRPSVPNLKENTVGMCDKICQLKNTYCC